MEKKNLSFYFLLPFCPVRVEVGSLLHLVLVTRSSLKMSSPYPLNVNMEAQHMLRRSLTVAGYAQKTGTPSIHYPCFQKLYLCPFLYFLVNKHSILSFLSADSHGGEDYFSSWQQHSLSFQVGRLTREGYYLSAFLIIKYLKSSKNVYHSVSVPGTLLSIFQFYAFCSPLQSLEKLSNLPQGPSIHKVWVNYSNPRQLDA